MICDHIWINVTFPFLSLWTFWILVVIGFSVYLKQKGLFHSSAQVTFTAPYCLNLYWSFKNRATGSFFISYLESFTSGINGISSYSLSFIGLDFELFLFTFFFGSPSKVFSNESFYWVYDILLLFWHFYFLWLIALSIIFIIKRRALKAFKRNTKK